MPLGMAVQFPASSNHPFDVSPNVILANDLLREPQREAYAALIAHWRDGTQSAIVVLPVGCGKSGLMAVLPFGTSCRRTLLVAPNTTIRAALAQAVDVSGESCFLKRMQIRVDAKSGPFCAVLDGRDVPLADCDASHYVVANIQQIVAAGDRWLNQFPADYFDLILIDEGHHNPAASWRKLFERFVSAKIVSLTATPFRSDGQDLIGDLVYRYTFSRAASRGYIKHLRALTVAPTQIYFTARDDTRIYTLEEVLKLREATWFRRGIALAPKCNWDIVRASAQKWLELRKATGTHHQIIAATCSTEHAEQVRDLYAKLGLRVAQIHSKLSPYERRTAIEHLREEQLDCIVQVDMLGEGFDHPPLSVAAIFRPFASLAPYVQFVGRIMRVLREAEPMHPENQGWVVSHAGLHVDRHWDDFHQLDAADQQYFRRLVRGQTAEQQELPMQKTRRSSPRREDKKPTPKLSPTTTPNPSISPSQPPRLRHAPAARKQLAPKTPPEPLTRRSAPAKQPQRAEKPAPPTMPDSFEDADGEVEFDTAGLSAREDEVLGPQQRRRHLRVALQLACKGAVGEVIRRLKVHPNGWQLFRRVKVGPGSNYVTVTKLVHQRLNSVLQVEPGQRQSLTLENTEQALVMLDRIVAQLLDELQPK